MYSNERPFIPPTPGIWYVYVLRGKKNKKTAYYVGVTKNLEKRLNQHKSHYGAWKTSKMSQIEMIFSKKLGVMSYETAELWEDAVKVLLSRYNSRVYGGRSGSEMKATLTSLPELPQSDISTLLNLVQDGRGD